MILKFVVRKVCRSERTHARHRAVSEDALSKVLNTEHTANRPSVSVRVLRRDAMTVATLTKERFNWGLLGL